MKKIYFANALFSEAEQTFNASVVKKIRENLGFEVYLPQENLSINDKSQFANSEQIYLADKNELDKSDILVAVLDGLTIDNGVCCEIGYFAAQNKPIVALYTDCRQMSDFETEIKKAKALELIAENQYFYVNLFVIGAVKANGKVVKSVDQLLDTLKTFL